MSGPTGANSLTRAIEMSYLGKAYTLEKTEKFDLFLAALGAPKEVMDAVLAEKSVETLEKNGDTYTLTMLGKTLRFQSGKEFDETINGREFKCTIVVDGNTITQIQKFGDAFTITYKKQYSDDKLVVEATSSVWDGVAYRHYSA